MLAAVAPTVARAVGSLSRRLGRGGGTTLPGVVLLRLDPDAIERSAGRLDAGSVVISATNGKTTTTRLVVDAAKALGYSVTTNRAGSNLERGVAAALLDLGRRRAELPVGSLGVFEVDEAALDAVVSKAHPRVIVLMNLFRDQLDRFGELETLLERWRQMLTNARAQPGPVTVVANADDPNLAELVRSIGNDIDVIWFGCNDATVGLDAVAHASDATTCRRCDHPIRHDPAYLGHLGAWACTNCEAQRPPLDIEIVSASSTATGQTVKVRAGEQHIVVATPLAGLHNAYNIVAAVGAALAVDKRRGPADGTSLSTVATALGRTQPAFGRGERVAIGTRELSILLAKNPTGVNQNIRTVLAAPDPVHILAMLNDRTADGRDVSWVWDVDWEPLIERAQRLTLTGDRAGDLALRMKYASADMSRVVVVDEADAALDDALGKAPDNATVHVLPTYTAMLDLRTILTGRGLVADQWDET